MFSKILIANRGEIAVRIIRACKEMGITSVAVYSEADRDVLHVALADESYCIGGSLPSDSYLCMDRLLQAAKACSASAIHPGYGFLSENAQFARLCEENGITFIGPSADTMERISDKATIKKRMSDAGLTVIPGFDATDSVETALEQAGILGYPLMLKARSGGGGRGIRPVNDEEELRRVFPLASTESAKAFGDGALYLEKRIDPARHIEVQILADEEGNVVCLGERDCSVQRRHQKLIEETPSPAVSPEERAKLFDAVTAAVKTLSYAGVGTLEFLLDTKGNFYFMEMNVRLQVEHSVTEMLTRVDLVKWQIRTAAGMSLNFSTESLRQRCAFDGSAIECRINGKRPGTVSMLHVPGGNGLRFDTHLLQGYTVPPYYDSLLGKLVVYAGSREEALRKMKAALCELVIDGVDTNIEQQLRIVSDPRFMSGEYDLGDWKDEE